jgi:nitrous oxide reductase accessory protein NosL
MEHDMTKATSTLTTLAMFFLLLTSGFAGSEISPAAKDKCAVCGMFVAKYPDWSAMIEYRNGRRVWFDGVKDLLKGYTSPVQYGLPKDRSEIKTIWVKDYYALTLVDGRTAHYVMGSDVLGPMGKELVPFAKEKDAKEFQKDHLGEKILRFDQLNPEILKRLE